MTTTIQKIIKGYESQLLNAEILKDKKKIVWLKNQINQANKFIAQFGIYNN